MAQTLGKALRIKQTTLSVHATIDDPTSEWLGYPCAWDINLVIDPDFNSGSTSDYLYDSNDVSVGDWISTSPGGIAVKITHILSVNSSTNIDVRVVDEDLYNILTDNTMSGTAIGPDTNGLLFPISPSGLPVLGPVPAFYVDANLQMDLLARFIQQNKINTGGGGSGTGSEFLLEPTDTSFKEGIAKGWTAGETRLEDAISHLNYMMDRAIGSRPTMFGSAILPVIGQSGTETLYVTGSIGNHTGKAIEHLTPVAAIRTLTEDDKIVITTESISNVGPGDFGTVSFGLNGDELASRALTGTDVGSYNGMNITTNGTFTADNGRSWPTYDVEATTLAEDGINEIHFTHTMSGTSTAIIVNEPVVNYPEIRDIVLTLGNSEITYASGVPHLTTGSVVNYSFKANNVVGRTVVKDGLFEIQTLPELFSKTISYGDAEYPTNLTQNMNNLSISGSITLDNANGAGESFVRIQGRNPFNLSSEEANKIILFAGEEHYGLREQNDEYLQPNMKRITLGNGDRPEVTSIDWDSSFNSGSSQNAGDLQNWDAPIIAGIGRHDQTNYASGYFPVGPNYSSKSERQYLTFKIKHVGNNIRLAIDGTYSGLFIKLPGITNNMPNAVNGWWDGMEQASFAPLNWPGHANAGDGCRQVEEITGTTFTFGNISSASSTDNLVIVRFALEAGDYINSIRIIK